MFSDIKTSPLFFQRVRYSITKQEDTAEWEKKKVYIYNYISDGMDGFQLEEGGKMCPDGWTRFGCSCYCKFKETKSWTESRKHCQDRGADLVIIDSPDEQEFVKTLKAKGESWIGLQGTWIEDMWTYEWRWVDGSPLRQRFWAGGWPKYTSYETYATCCNDEGKWTHRYYNYPNNWICEK